MQDFFQRTERKQKWNKTGHKLTTVEAVLSTVVPRFSNVSIDISVYEHHKFYGSMVSLGSKIHAKFAVLGVGFEGLERINPFCITFYGETVPRFSNVSETEPSSGTDYVRKSRYH